MLLAAAGDDEGFEVIYCRLAGRLLIRSEAPVISRLVSSDEGHDRALFVFSDHSQTHRHLVNVRHGEGGRLFRRIAVGPGEELRTATERIALLDAETAGPSALDLQTKLEEAFDVEKVTSEFFREYARVFERVEGSIEGIESDERRLFTQRLFNRLMFIAFVQKKDWLRFGGRTDYLNALLEDYDGDGFEDKNFYRDRLKFLFFEGLSREGRYEAHGANRGGYTAELIGQTPYLNGGLFERGPDDEDENITVPDRALREIQQNIGEDAAILEPGERLNPEAMYAIYHGGESGSKAAEEDEDSLDDLGEAVEMLRQLRDENPDEFRRIASLRDGIRAANLSSEASLFLMCRAGSYRQLYLLDESGEVISRDAARALRAIRADPGEPGEPLPGGHNEAVMRAKERFDEEVRNRCSERENRRALSRVQRYARRELQTLFKEMSEGPERERVAQIDRALANPLAGAVERKVNRMANQKMRREELLAALEEIYIQHQLH